LLESIYKVILTVLVAPLLALVWFCRQQRSQSYSRVSPTVHEKPKPARIYVIQDDKAYADRYFHANHTVSSAPLCRFLLLDNKNKGVKTA
jgi:hypothetical protein